MTIDLHIHTNASDGSCNPVDVLHLAVEKGLKTIAFADHETTSGYSQACKEACLYDIKLIPAVELLTVYKNKEVHLLGYFTDPDNRTLQKELAELRYLRSRCAEETVRKLQNFGFNIRWEEVQQLAEHDALISKGHIMRAMNNAGYIKSRSDAQAIMKQYLSFDGLAYTSHEFTFDDGVGLIKAAGGVPVLAHPALINDDTIVEELCHRGIDGMEVYYCYFGDKREEWVKSYSLIAESSGLLKTGGSDYHGTYTPVVLGETMVPPEEVREFLKLFGEK